MKSLISCLGFVPQHFCTYVNIDRLIQDITDGNLRANGRRDCYDVPDSLVSFIASLEQHIGCPISIEDECEIFAPSADYPAHVDACGMALAIPLTEGATITVDNFTIAAEKTALYVFDDNIPHKTVGVFLMISLSIPL